MITATVSNVVMANALEKRPGKLALKTATVKLKLHHMKMQTETGLEMQPLQTLVATFHQNMWKMMMIAMTVQVQSILEQLKLRMMA